MPDSVAIQHSFCCLHKIPGKYFRFVSIVGENVLIVGCGNVKKFDSLVGSADQDIAIRGRI